MILTMFQTNPFFGSTQGPQKHLGWSTPCFGGDLVRAFAEQLHLPGVSGQTWGGRGGHEKVLLVFLNTL